MEKKVVEWNWDNEARLKLFQELRNLPEKVAHEVGGKSVLDVGGWGGSLANRMGYDFPVCVDISPHDNIKKVHYVRGDVLRLPFSDESFDYVIAKAVLHHVPDNLDGALSELYRVTKRGGTLLVEEPTSTNFIASTARKFITTTSHDEDERPLEPKKLKKIIEKYWTISEFQPHFFFTYLIPETIDYLPRPLKKPMRKVMMGLKRLENNFLFKSDFFSYKGAYVSFVCKKK